MFLAFLHLRFFPVTCRLSSVLNHLQFRIDITSFFIALLFLLLDFIFPSLTLSHVSPSCVILLLLLSLFPLSSSSLSQHRHPFSFFLSFVLVYLFSISISFLFFSVTSTYAFCPLFFSLPLSFIRPQCSKSPLLRASFPHFHLSFLFLSLFPSYSMLIFPSPSFYYSPFLLPRPHSFLLSLLLLRLLSLCLSMLILLLLFLFLISV